MRKLSLFIVSLSALGLLGCDVKLSGRMNVTESFNLVDRKGKAFTLPVGPRAVQMELEDVGEGRSHETLKIQVNDATGKERKVSLKVPGGVLPDRSGDFRISGDQVGQSFDLMGTINTVETDSERVRRTQSCTYYVQEYRCWRVAVRMPDGRIRYETHCGYVDVAVTGRQEIEYHTHTINVDGNGSFMDSGNRSLATWTGNYRNSTQVTDYQSPCYRY